MATRPEIDDEDDYLEIEQIEPTGARRFVPAIILLVVVGGFMGLAWYAYHAGTHSVKEEDLLLIEADKSPTKEKPADPGGMKFPHQDKTIFETISPSAQKVEGEKVMPGAEEPVDVVKATEGSEESSKNWVNEKLESKPAESIPLSDDKAADKPVAQFSAPVEPVKEEPKAVIEVPVAPVKAVETPPAKSEKLTTLPTKKETQAAKPASGSGTIQLGAYKSDAEARTEWKKIAAKHKELPSGKEPTVVRADLDKGTYYRLRVAGVADAKGVCSKLSAKGQACMVVK